MENIYTLLYEFKDGRNPLIKKSFSHKQSAEYDAAFEEACNGYKCVTVAQEQYWEGTNKRGDIYCSYGFLTAKCELFQCVEKSLEECRAKRDRWILLPIPRPKGIKDCLSV